MLTPKKIGRKAMEANRRDKSSSMRGIFVILVAVVCVFGGTVFGQPWDGNGVEGDPYQIWDANDMQAIGANSNYWDAHFLLCADINLGVYTGTSFNIIGVWGSVPFSGVFDGNGHSISNFTYSADVVDGIGLFGFIEEAEIENVVLVEPNVEAGSRSYVGSLAGYVQSGIVTGCCCEGGSVSGGYYVGGLVGYNDHDSIFYCYSTASVSGNDYVGGLLGKNYRGTVSNCYSMGTVWGSGGIPGGLIGENTYGTVIQSYSTGAVSSAGGRACGLIGYSSTGSLVWECFWDVNSSGQDRSPGGKGKTTVEMQDPNTYIAWSCGSIWTIDGGNDYPRLWWENMPGAPLPGQLSDFLVGAGTEGEPYLIYTPEELSVIGAFTCEWDKHFKLMADIDLSSFIDSDFRVIGHKVSPFTGFFDGNNRTVSNLTLKGGSGIGLFGNVSDSNAVIQSIGLIDPNIEGDDGVGSLVGNLANGSVIGCFVEGGSVRGKGWTTGGMLGGNSGLAYDCYSTCDVEGYYYVGGLVGSNGGAGRVSNCYSEGDVTGFRPWTGGLVGTNTAYISNSYATGNVSGESAVGGLAGISEGVGATVSNCYSSGSVVGNGGSVGGLVGYNRGAIRNCYSLGSVIGDDDVGGLIGNNYSGTYGEIAHCYSSAIVSGATDVGGLAGSDNSGIFVSCFWDNTVNPSLPGIGNSSDPNVIGQSTAHLQVESTFISAGWDFVGEFENGPSDDWAMPPGGGYPIMWWQLSPLPPLPSFSGGTGEVNDPFLISNANDLSRIEHNSRLMYAHFKLIDDIDLTGIEMVLIGNTVFRFVGSFDGNRHTISNFTHDSNVAWVKYTGLFRYVGDKGQIKDLGLSDPNVDVGGGTEVGALVGWLRDGKISGCWVNGGSISGHSVVGGLVGYASGVISNCSTLTDVSAFDDYVGGLAGGNSGLVSDCYSTSTVSGDGQIGGLTGNNFGTITKCYVDGSVSGGSSGGLVGENYGIVSECFSGASVSGMYAVGGLIGRNWRTIADCYSNSSVSGTSTVGGLVGSNSGSVSNCYSASRVSGVGFLGGFAGLGNEGDYTSSFWDADINPDVNGIGNHSDPNVIGESTANMQMENTYISGGWDFIDESDNGIKDIWRLCSAGTNYPKFVWQLLLLGDFGCPDGVDGIDLGVLCEEWLLEELSADVWPEGGDGFVNFLDWAIFADGWGDTYDIFDLADFAGEWLRRGTRVADIAPYGGDGIVNVLDYAVLADNWLAGI